MTQHDSKASRVIYRNISRIPGWKNYKSDSVFIQCPFHAGDSTPSGRINLDSSAAPYGWYYCFGCGTSTHWNSLAIKLGLEQVQRDDFKKDRIIARDREELRQELLEVVEGRLEHIAKAEGYGFMLEYPKSKAWRGISGELLHSIGAKLVYEDRDKDTAVILPVVVDGNTVGAIKARRVKEEGSKSYITSEGNWLKVRGLFPLDYALSLPLYKKTKCLVLVEGPRDALRLLRHGIPAVAILGSQSWSIKKRDLLISMGVEKLYIMMDGDVAGVRATNKIYKNVHLHLSTKVLKLKKISEKLGRDVDPGNIPIIYIARLKKKLQGSAYVD